MDFSYDLDTTSLGLIVIKRDEKVAHSVMDDMLEYTNPDGIIQVSDFLSFSYISTELTNVNRLILTILDHGLTRLFVLTFSVFSIRTGEVTS